MKIELKSCIPYPPALSKDSPVEIYFFISESVSFVNLTLVTSKSLIVFPVWQLMRATPEYTS